MHTQASSPRATRATACTLDQLSHPHPVPLSRLMAARSSQAHRPSGAPSPAAAPASPSPAAASPALARAAAGMASAATSPSPAASPAAHLLHPSGSKLLPSSPPRLATAPAAFASLGSPPSSATSPRYPAFPPHVSRRPSAINATHHLLGNVPNGPEATHPYLLPPSPHHHSASSLRPAGVAPSPSVFTVRMDAQAQPAAGLRETQQDCTL